MKGGPLVVVQQVQAIRMRRGGQLTVAAVTRDVSARVELARQLPGETVLLLFPDHATAARTLGEGEPSSGQAIPESPAIAYGALLIDPLRQAVTWHGIPLALTKLERAVLASLAEPPLQAWSYERLYQAAWGGHWLGDTSALHATIKRLRRKLRAAGVTLIPESVRGVGFRLDDQGGPAGQAPARAAVWPAGHQDHAGPAAHRTGAGLSARWRRPAMNQQRPGPPLVNEGRARLAERTANSFAVARRSWPWWSYLP
jgi:DNA-binding response OmpR family regulator